MPGWRFWLLTVLGFPVTGVAVLFLVSIARAPWGLAALGLLALESWLLTHARTVRRMSQRRRTVWVVIGCTMTAIVAALGASVLFFVALLNHCAAEGC